MGAHAAGDLQEESVRTERGRSHFGFALKYGGQRVSAGVSLQVVMVVVLAALSAVPQMNCDIFQEQYRTTIKGSMNMISKEVHSCFRKKSTLCAAALLQDYSKTMVHTMIGTGTLLIHVWPLGALFSSYGTDRIIYDWWRVRLKRGSTFL